MAEINLLQPVVLQGVVEKLKSSDNLILRKTVPEDPYPFNTRVWDVIRGSRAVARPNVPNAEAHIVGRLGRAQETASHIYIREKHIFDATTLYWLREPGKLNSVNAERSVMRQLAEANRRLENFAELALWRALSGHISLRYADVVAEIDYHFPASHRVTMAEAWGLDTTTPVDIVQDIRCLKRLVSRDSGVKATQVYGTEATFALVFDKWAASNVSLSVNGAYLMSDRMRDEYYSAGTLSGFMGLNWTTVESYYEDDATAYDPGSPAGTGINFIPDGVLFLGNYTENRPIKLSVGPTADLDAPQGFTGKFSKTWTDKDPSGRQYLIEWNIVPVIEYPEQFVVACVGPTTSCDQLPSTCALPGGASAFPVLPGSRP